MKFCMKLVQQKPRELPRYRPVGCLRPAEAEELQWSDCLREEESIEKDAERLFQTLECQTLKIFDIVGKSQTQFCGRGSAP